MSDKEEEAVDVGSSSEEEEVEQVENTEKESTVTWKDLVSV